MERSTYVDLSEAEIIQIKQALAISHNQALLSDVVNLWGKLNSALIEIKEIKEQAQRKNKNRVYIDNGRKYYNM